MNETKAAHAPGPLHIRDDWHLFSAERMIANARGEESTSRTETEEARACARLLAAAYTSYDKHCGPRAVECAEGDLLGELLDACRRLMGSMYSAERAYRSLKQHDALEFAETIIAKAIQ